MTIVYVLYLCPDAREERAFLCMNLSRIGKMGNGDNWFCGVFGGGGGIVGWVVWVV